MLNMDKAMRVSERCTRNPLAHDVVGSGPPLILLHGLSGSGRWGRRNIPAFAERFRTYAVDLPGFGESRRVRWSRLDDTADRLAAELEREALPAAHVAGHSLGGAVAARLAARHPERVDRLVLVDAAIRPRGTRASPRAADLAHTFGRRQPGFAPMLVQDLLRCHPWSFVAASVDALQSDWERHLPRIAAPTLVVWGEYDAITPVGLGHQIVASVPNAQLVTVPNAGHSPMWEQPEVFNAEVLRFLGERPDTGR
jgi:pimeloyl-ACP methyl ester carboxylesterase